MASILHSIIPPRLDPLRATEAGKARPRRGTGQQILGPAFPEAVLFLCLLALPRGPEPPQQAETATGVLSPAQRVGDLQRDVQAVLQLIGAGSLAVEVLFRAVCPASLDLCGDLGSLRACFRKRPMAVSMAAAIRSMALPLPLPWSAESGTKTRAVPSFPSWRRHL